MNDAQKLIDEKNAQILKLRKEIQQIRKENPDVVIKHRKFRTVSVDQIKQIAEHLAKPMKEAKSSKEIAAIVGMPYTTVRHVIICLKKKATSKAYQAYLQFLKIENLEQERVWDNALKCSTLKCVFRLIKQYEETQGTQS